ALLMLTGSLLALARWLDDGRWRHAWAYGLLAALTVHFHFLLAYNFLVHFLYVAWRAARGTPATLKQFALVAVAVTALLGPLATHLAVLLGEREKLSFAHAPLALDLVNSLLPPPVLIPICIGGLAVMLVSRAFAWEPVPAPTPSFVLVALSALVPAVLLFTVSAVSPTKVFVPRYLLAAAPGMALLVGYAIRCVRPAWARWPIAGLALAVSTAGISGFSPWPVHHREDWRGALRTIAALTRENPAPVVVYSGLVEAADPRRLSDPRHREYILAPLAAYPLPAPDIIPLPYRCNALSTAFFDLSSFRSLRAVSRFLLVLRLGTDHDGAAWLSYIGSRMAKRGFKAALIGEFGLVSVWQFER
ncbi:MAG: hypothetical protein AAB225_30290, partial [Acidobacteriota bacterium]